MLGKYLENIANCSPICWPNSLVGASIRACVCFKSGSIQSKSGKPKAAVLPVPVWARPIKSCLFSIKRGIAFSCIGEGDSNPSSGRTRITESERFKSENFFIFIDWLNFVQIYFFN